MTYDIAIIGAGIVGAACAFRLSLEGFKVIVLEGNQIAGGTTAAGMGHIVVMDDSEAQFSLTNFSQKLWNKLSPQLPKNSEYDLCGTIWVASDGEELEEAKRKKLFYNKRNVRAEILDEQSLRKAEPNLREGLAGGLFVPGDSVVYQLCATRFFLEKAGDVGTKVLTGAMVVKINSDGVNLQNGDTIKAQKVVNAGGVLAKDLIKDLPIVRRKGHLAITERYPNFVSHQLVELGYLKSAHSNQADSVAFNVQPRLTGQVLIGSSRQFGVGGLGIDFQILKKMIKRATNFMPGLNKTVIVRTWAGFRPATPDNLPLIGKHPAFENVYLATGHEGLGITTSLGTAEILTDEILQRESEIDREAYSPNRFLG